MTKPTPGPWTVEAVWDSYGVYRVLEAERRLEALAAQSVEIDAPDSVGIGQEFADEENAANARMIASATEMRDVLILIVRGSGLWEAGLVTSEATAHLEQVARKARAVLAQIEERE